MAAAKAAPPDPMMARSTSCDAVEASFIFPPLMGLSPISAPSPGVEGQAPGNSVPTIGIDERLGMRIGEVAAATGTTAKTLRFCEESGLLARQLEDLVRRIAELTALRATVADYHRSAADGDPATCDAERICSFILGWRPRGWCGAWRTASRSSSTASVWPTTWGPR
ncbi:MerR family DNA-binding transcriptional regulator [Arthrobacter sp. KK5.5]|uniref:MerR family DNA-binding transcriptional regulator n=1 Tax=Arthrobacter sp. KK5.5 TaxID=3373084 RepID=UPI003EE6692D